MVADPMYARSQRLNGWLASYELVDYDGLGEQLRILKEGSETFFTPWSAVIRIEPGFAAHEAVLENFSQPS